MPLKAFLGAHLEATLEVTYLGAVQIRRSKVEKNRKADFYLTYRQSSCAISGLGVEFKKLY